MTTDDQTFDPRHPIQTDRPSPTSDHPTIDYDRIAGIYDRYADTDYDHAFFTREVEPGARVLELTSGTGRLSIPLIQAGADLTCVDVSQGMLDVLERKLSERGLSARVICEDIERLSLGPDFELAILPFQSFMELIGESRQRAALAAVRRALVPGGRFFCTLHNPEIRRRNVDGCLRCVGSFPDVDDTLVVSGFELGGSPVVTRTQFFEYFDAAGELRRKTLLRMRFELIGRDDFERMATGCGLRVRNLFGGYDGRDFDPATSPVMIWELERPAT
ncbi:class I SAM-dependent methyltransferase [Imhoffiella purpurea]|uniref:Methyltransferase n=1 Tax=Imhoffiella purpurea TaxID=1249627 RepID=W9UZZ5_9GAMM|nr:class I SAM-dependent methyltransferase [Imhoffiella purpurea]EXJ12659.1 Methyltransferase [Imhoffiella purpurea]